MLSLILQAKFYALICKIIHFYLYRRRRFHRLSLFDFPVANARLFSVLPNPLRGILHSARNYHRIRFCRAFLPKACMRYMHRYRLRISKLLLCRRLSQPLVRTYIQSFCASSALSVFLTISSAASLLSVSICFFFSTK